MARARKLEAKKAKRATKTEFIVDATIISRMIVASALSNRSEFSVCTAAVAANLIEVHGDPPHFHD